MVRPTDLTSPPPEIYSAVVAQASSLHSQPSDNAAKIAALQLARILSGGWGTFNKSDNLWWVDASVIDGMRAP